MPEERDYDYGICKVPRKDRNGNDISGDRIGKGGRHRSDGTYSGAVYDVELVSYDPSVPQTRTVYRDRPVYIRQPVYVEQEDSFLKDLTREYIREYAPVLIERGVKAAINGIKDWRAVRKERKNAERVAEAERRRREALMKEAASRNRNREPLRSDRIKEETAVAESKTATIEIPDGFDSAYEQYSVNMTSEEAQKDLLDAFVFYVLAIKKLNRVAKARIVDSSGNITDGHAVIEKISAPEVIGKINTILERNPGLLETWQSVALSDIIGRNMAEETEFVPIDSKRFRQGLLLNADKE